MPCKHVPRSNLIHQHAPHTTHQNWARQVDFRLLPSPIPQSLDAQRHEQPCGLVDVTQLPPFEHAVVSQVGVEALDHTRHTMAGRLVQPRLVDHLSQTERPPSLLADLSGKAPQWWGMHHLAVLLVPPADHRCVAAGVKHSRGDEVVHCRVDAMAESAVGAELNVADGLVSSVDIEAQCRNVPGDRRCLFWAEMEDGGDGIIRGAVIVRREGQQMGEQSGEVTLRPECSVDGVHDVMTDTVEDAHILTLDHLALTVGCLERWIAFPGGSDVGSW
mmetsp:Transcript_34392/g.99050  ORF Transcript_34392/g.99050 Transcript_34392/m.99050 type:complete len:274 (+) Transcript_34392:738-1559(+)